MGEGAEYNKLDFLDCQWKLHFDLKARIDKCELSNI